MTRITSLLFTISCLFTTGSFAQGDSSYQNLYFVKKGDSLRFDKQDYRPGKHAFYLYRNCLYDVVLSDKKRLVIQVTDTRNDSIYYVGYHEVRKDTLVMHPSQLLRLKMIGDQTMGLFSTVAFRKYRYSWEQSGAPKVFKKDTQVVYNADSSRASTYIMAPYLTAQGIRYQYDPHSITYYCGGVVSSTPCKDTTPPKPPVVKNWAWFTPSNATRINGLAIGLQTMPLDKDSLAIRGVNINADVLSFFIACFLLVRIGEANSLKDLPDTVSKAMTSEMTGLSLSAGGLVGDIRVRGVSINGAVLAVTKANGLHITGSQNLSNEFNGVMITGLRNTAIKGRGLQIGLWNICKDLKGMQVGLWNVNSKRKLPFLNWSF
jgi:hypothetical protein